MGVKGLRRIILFLNKRYMLIAQANCAEFFTNLFGLRIDFLHF